ncbi:MAG: ABC transporter permease subunit [Chloroflexi bacterium]|nr:ABC transporter permease subunit [Chloroflexota bacterium]
MKRIFPRLEEAFFKLLMQLSLLVVAGSLALILAAVIAKGLPAFSLEMLTQTPQGGFYMGKEGGILNAILGSMALAGGATLLALLLSLPIAVYLQAYARRSRLAAAMRLALDILWGIPSIVYGAFGFTLMLALGLRASLLGGILALTLLELPIMARAMDETLRMSPADLEGAAFALGATRLEAALHIAARQALPGLSTAALLAFGRGAGDAASVLFTAGYTDRLPSSLLRPAASLPLAVFFQLSVPFPEVQARAYASALALTLLVLAVSLGSRWLAGRLNRFII